MRFDKEPTRQNPDLQLGKMIAHGGSSIVYEMPGGKVAKEALSSVARDLVGNQPITKAVLSKIALREAALLPAEKSILLEEAEKAKEKLTNNIAVCKRYLGDFLVDTDVLIGNNRNSVPVITIIQDALPKNHITLQPDGWNMTVDDAMRAQLQKLITAIEQMYAETAMMIDLLTLANVAFSASNNKFFIYDVDPLICAPENMEALGEQYNVDGWIDHGYTTHNDNVTQNALEANLEHLEVLKSLLSVAEGNR